jgi:metal-responsive CopG/Arc/MetJ family transcriptional regulator
MKNRINARLDDALARKVARVSRESGQSVSALIKAALEAYCDRADARTPDAKAILQRSGFISSSAGSPELSTTYKLELTRSLASKT